MKASKLVVSAAVLALGVPAARATDSPVTILDTLNADPATTFDISFGGWGGPGITAQQHLGPAFSLDLPTTITEIGGFLNNCVATTCNGSQLPLAVEIRRAVGGVPDKDNVIASFAVSDDGNPGLVSYESAKPNLVLAPGNYFALFAPQRPEDYATTLSIWCNRDRACVYHPAVAPVGQVNPGVSTTAGSGPFPARILGIEHVPPTRLTGSVGPGAKISFPRSAKAGETIITIRDRTKKDNFHLSGPGVNRRTGVAFTGTASWTLTLRSGTYSFRSDAHPALGGRMTVS